MTQPRRPVFWFLWPQPDPNLPCDEFARQDRLVRISPRGPIRIILLVAGSLITVVLCATAVLAALGGALTAGTLIGSAIAASAVALLLRAWVVGTYVNDAGILIETTFTRRSIPWTGITALECTDTVVPLLGTPLRVRGSRVVLDLADGARVPTHVSTASADLWGRPEAFDVARIRLANWQQGA